MSIDREINARVEAYGSNPQALQKKYAMTKELVDLLALQKIKKSMDSARAAVEAQMQTNPATIKQQREQEVFGRTAQDVAQQLGGVLQTAKNQQMAQRRPAPQGLGALMPQQGQRPQQPQRMQAGGIVAFQQGGNVDAKKIQQFVNMGLTDDQIRAEVEKLGLLPQAADRIIQQVRLQQKQDMSLQPPQPKTQSIDLVSDDPVLATQGTQPPPKTPPPTQVQTSPTQTQTSPDPDPASSGIATAAKGFPNIIGEDGKRKSATQLVTEMGPLEAPQIDTSKANEAGLAVLKDFGMGPDDLKDPEQYRKDVRDDEADFFRRKEKMENYQRMIDRQEALNAEQSDPKALAREQLQAGLIGMAGRGSTAGAGFGAGAMTMGRSQKRDAQNRLKRVADMVDTMEKQDLELAKKASDVGREALSQAGQDRRTALEAMYTMRGQEVQTVINQAKLDFQADEGNLKTIVSAAVADATRELNMAMQSADEQRTAEEALIRFKTKIQELIEKEIKGKSLGYDAAENTMNDPNATAEQKADAKRVIDAMALRIQQFRSERNENGVSINDIEEKLARAAGIPELPAVGAPVRAGIAQQLSPAGQAALQRNLPPVP